MHRGELLSVEALWPTLLIGLAVFVLLYLFHVGALAICNPQTRRRRVSEKTKRLVKMSEPATRCEVCLRETTMQCSRCKVVKYCSADCQRKHWHHGHKVECQPLGTGKRPAANGHAKKAPKAQLTPAASDSGGALASRLLFPYSDFVDLFNWQELVREPCGIVNVGNSCYANAVLQCLTYTWPLASYLLEREHSSECEKGSTEFCFMCELEEHVNRALRGSVPIVPQRILARVRNVGASLGYGRQEDAHEFMRFAVDSMQATFLEEAGGEKNIDHATQETTLIHHIFGGRLQSQVKCMTCLTASNTYESVLDLTVEITGSVNSLEGALHTFTSPEWLDGDNKYKCDNCNAYVRGCKRLSIYEGPNILSIVLKRFQGGHFGKVNKAIAYPETLNLTPFMSDKGDKPGPYHLYAVIVHLDMLNSTFFGHYLCFVKDASGRWYEADDSDVRATTIDTVLGQKAYMLFYARSEPRPPPRIHTPPSASKLSNGISSPTTSPPDRAPSSSSGLTSDSPQLRPNGHAASSDSGSTVNGHAEKGLSANGTTANGIGAKGVGVNGITPLASKDAACVTSAYTGPANGLGTEAGATRNIGVETERVHAQAAVERLLREVDTEDVSLPIETNEGREMDGNGGEFESSSEDEEGAQFADSVLSETPNSLTRDCEGLGATQRLQGGKQKWLGNGANGSFGETNRAGPTNGVKSGDPGRSGGSGEGVPRWNRPGGPSLAGGSTEQKTGVLVAAGEVATETVGILPTPSKALPQGVGQNGPRAEGKSRTAVSVQANHRTVESESHGKGTPTEEVPEQKAGAGVKRPLMASTPSPALVSQPGAARAAPVQLIVKPGEHRPIGELEIGVEICGEGLESGIHSVASGRNAAEKAGGSFVNIQNGSPERGVDADGSSARGKKRSTYQASNGGLSHLGESLGAGLDNQGVTRLEGNGGFPQEGQLEELSRLLNTRPLDALNSDVWDSVLGGGLPNPPLPDESFLEDEELEALSQPEPLFLPAQTAGPFDQTAENGAHSEQGVNAGLNGAGTGPFGLGTAPFTPIFTAQPSGKEGGRGKHGANSGLARGFFGPAKAKRKSDKRPHRPSEVVLNVEPIEPVPTGAGFEDGVEVSGLETGEDFNEPPHFADELVDELVLTTDTSTDEKKSSGGVKPKGIADLIENEDLLREVGKSADQRLRSVVKGKVESKTKQGRNDVCNCGSGKKWKKCHGKGVAA